MPEGYRPVSPEDPRRVTPEDVMRRPEWRDQVREFEDRQRQRNRDRYSERVEEMRGYDEYRRQQAEKGRTFPTGKEARETMLSMVALGGELGESLDRRFPQPRTKSLTPKIDRAARLGLKGAGWLDLALMFKEGYDLTDPEFRKQALARNELLATKGSLLEQQFISQANPVTTVLGTGDTRARLSKQLKKGDAAREGAGVAQETQMLMDHWRRQKGPLSNERKLWIHNALKGMTHKEIRKLHERVRGKKIPKLRSIDRHIRVTNRHHFDGERWVPIAEAPASYEAPLPAPPARLYNRVE
jgi:hypothetical protein